MLPKVSRWPAGKGKWCLWSVPCGDVVDVFLFKNKKDWAEGYPLVFHEFSPKRATPFCRHYGDWRLPVAVGVLC